MFSLKKNTSSEGGLLCCLRNVEWRHTPSLQLNRSLSTYYSNAKKTIPFAINTLDKQSI